MGGKVSLIGAGLGLAAAMVALSVLINQIVLLQNRLGSSAAEACEEGVMDSDGEVVQGEVTSLAEDEIPEDMLEIYQDVANQWDMDWALLASVGMQESTHGTDPNTEAENHAGALGPMQFIPVAWEAHGLHYGDKSGDEGTPPLEDRLDAETAVWSAAHKLTDQGANDNPENALVRYYGADTDGYVDSVTDRADDYRDGNFSSGTGGELIEASAELDCPEEEPSPREASGELYISDECPQVADPNLQASTCRGHAAIEAEFGDPWPGGVGCYDPRPWENPPLDHPKGLACDYMVATDDTDRVPSDAMHEVAVDLSDWLIQHQEELNVSYIIYRYEIWDHRRGDPPGAWDDVARPSSTFMTGDPTQDHVDHVHVSYYP